MAGLGAFLTELRRRRVYRATGIYVVSAWVAVQVASLVFPAIDVPESAIRYVWMAAILLFPIALVFAWFFDVSSDGISRTPPRDAAVGTDLSLRKADYWVIGALVVVAVSVTWRTTANIQSQPPGSVVADQAEPVDPLSIAILPLENVSGDSDEQYFVSGMHDALISGLSRIPELKVTSKTSTLQFAGQTGSVRGIASQLGVAKLIEGSVFRVGDDVRISVRLVDALEDRQIWSDIFEEDIRDVLRLQREVAEAIAEEVEVAVTDSGIDRSVDPAAFEAYLKGQFHVERFTPEDMAAAAQFYQQAVRLDPDYALAHYGISKLCAFQAQVGLISPSTARENCLPPISRALTIDPDLPEAHMGYAGHMTWQRYDWGEAGKGFRNAIRLNPSYAEARIFYAHYLAIIGELDESNRQADLAAKLDPFNPFTLGLQGGQRWLVGDPASAIEMIEGVMAAAPGFGFGFDILWPAYHESGDYDNAAGALLGLLKTVGADHPGVAAYEGYVEEHGYPGALIPTARVLIEHQESRPSMPTTIGMLFEYGGDLDTALDWFELAVETGSPDAPYLGPAMGSSAVHEQPRFIQLLRRMKLDYWADQYEGL